MRLWRKQNVLVPPAEICKYVDYVYFGNFAVFSFAEGAKAWGERCVEEETLPD